MQFKPVKPKKISTQVADQIRESILGGDFVPGDKLPPERELAEMFGVSRPSVREAINVLSSAGLVVAYQGGGTVVQSLVDLADRNALSGLIRDRNEQALQVLEVRKCMEAWIAYYAAERALPEDIRRLDEIILKMEEDLSKGLPQKELDADLHILIAKACHNIIWVHLMQTIFDTLKEFQHCVWDAVYQTSEDHQLLFAHHKAIVSAIRERKPDAAKAAMKEHLTFAEKRSAFYITKTSS